MANLKLVINDPKTGKAYQREASEEATKQFQGLKINGAVKGEIIGLAGYEFLVTGGSDYCGFPMRADVLGIGRKRILAVSGVGIKKKRKGMKQRKTVCGNTIGLKTAQVSLKITKYGKEKLGKEEEKPKVAKPKEAPKKEEKKPEIKKEEKPKAKKKAEEKPKVAKPKEAPKKEEKKPEAEAPKS